MKLLERASTKKREEIIIVKRVGRIAVYDAPTAPPRLIKIEASGWDELIEKLTTTSYKESQQKGGSFPYVVLREVVENLIHANFQEIVISILSDGNTIRITDQGPGISDKSQAFEPGFTTATEDMKRYIRGVGSGLPVVREIMTFSGGNVEIKDNLASGTVITLSLASSTKKAAKAAAVPALTRRQIGILSLITELGVAGPSEINKELDLSLSTAHRELICLEDEGLLKSDSQGKRECTSKGLGCLSETITTAEEL